MEIQKLLRTGPVLAAVGLIALLPMSSMGAAHGNCASTRISTATPDSRGLLNGMWKDAQQVARQSESLQSLADHPAVHTRMQTEELASIQATASDMENRLCRLEAMKASPPSAEQRAIFEAAPLVRSIANDTTAAIGDHGVSIAYGGYTQVLDSEAQALATNIDISEHVAAMHQRSVQHQ